MHPENLNTAAFSFVATRKQRDGYKDKGIDIESKEIHIESKGIRIKAKREKSCRYEKQSPWHIHPSLPLTKIPWVKEENIPHRLDTSNQPACVSFTAASCWKLFSFSDTEWEFWNYSALTWEKTANTVRRKMPTVLSQRFLVRSFEGSISLNV